MKLLTRSQLRFLRSTPWSTLTLFAGILVGIASIVAVHLISVRVAAELEAATPAHLAGVSHLLERPDLSAEDYFELRREWRAGRHPHIRALMPVVEGRLAVVDSSKDPEDFTIVGVDGLSGLSSAALLALLPPGQVVAGSGSGLKVGSRLSHGAVVAAVLDGVPSGLLLTDIGTAQVLLGLDDRVLTRVAVSVADPWTQAYAILESLLPGFSAGFPAPEWHLQHWQVRTLDAELPSLAFGRSVLFNLGALSSLALLVSWLLVYQVGIIWLRRRRPVLDRLVIMGVSDGELLRGHLSSLVLLAVPASGGALLLGGWLAGVLTRMAAGDQDIEIRGAVDAWVVIKALGSAAIAGLLGGWYAFRREWRETDTRRRSWPLLLFLGLVAIAAPLITDALWGGFLSILAAGLLVVFGVLPLLGWLKDFSHRMVGVSLLARVGLRELVWFPRDLAVAVGALALALATSLALALMVDSFRRDFSAMLDMRLGQDVYLRDAGMSLDALSEELLGRDGVVRVRGSGSAPIRVGGNQAELGYADFDADEAGRYGHDSPLALWECLLSERLARTLDAGVGDDLELGSDRRLRVAALFPGYGDATPRILVDTTTAEALGHSPVIDRLSIGTRDAAIAQRLAAELRARFPAAQIEQQEGLRRQALRIFDQTFAITHALTLLALIVAAVALYNALLALKLIQHRSLKLLEALGVSALERRLIECWRSVAVGAMALGLALPLGISMGWLLCSVINPRAFGWSLHLVLNWSAFLPTLLAAAAAIGIVTLLPTPLERLDESD